MSRALFPSWTATQEALACLWRGDRQRAAEILGVPEMRASWPNRWLAAWLSRRLVKSAFGHWTQKAYSLAWAEFTAAEKLTSPTRMDWLLAHKSRLVEETISVADQLRADGAHESARSALGSFQVWVDGVGGYLVCPGPSVTAGSFVEQPGIEIPLQADLRRRHLRLELQCDRFLATPLGPTQLNGQRLSQPTLLADGSVLTLTGQVRWRFTQPHPLSSSARLDYLSPHRSIPWSDAVLLLADTLVFGPARCNHVVCPDWNHDLVLFRRHGQLYARSDSPLCVDGRPVGNVAALRLDSSITGEEGGFSVKLEPARSLGLVS
jgi:hypothetical protein